MLEFFRDFRTQVTTYFKLFISSIVNPVINEIVFISNDSLAKSKPLH
ncbi:hypothetical protein MNB_SV-9-1206 [hydrothermal vent metagenome]|uniref:Uncharacterized protein n=1 Tax=hydrothermal vent metagenome TaxID=652676 RepID=A0A1W1BBD9_9ZZZZ